MRERVTEPISGMYYAEAEAEFAMDILTGVLQP